MEFDDWGDDSYPLRAAIITIGDELLIGQVVDTNSAWMAQKLNESGIELYRISSVHDNRRQILDTIDEAFCEADIILTTGGLGPTNDDITKQVLCEYFSTDLIEDVRVRAHIMDLYKDRPDVLNRLTATQWQVPEAAEILENRVGSAPLMVFNKRDQILVSMPGVPYEMKVAMEEQILPYVQNWLKDRGQQPRIIHRTMQVTGIPESSLAIQLEDYENSLPEDLHLAYLPKDGIIRLRLSSYGEMNEEEMNTWFERLKSLVSDYLIADTDEPLEVIVGRLLKQKGQTVGSAESCTGGKIAALLSKHPGSSDFYKGSIIAYSNEVKHNVLHVCQQDLDTYGAVSEQVVRQMALGVRQVLNTDYAVATSGVAGPSGGTPDKPVGTVWTAVATPDEVYTECFHLGKLREQITDRACTKMLVKLIKLLQ